MELSQVSLLLTLIATAVTRNTAALPRADVLQTEGDVNTPTSAGHSGDRFDEFDWKLCKAVHEADSGNVVISPISLKVVLAMLYEGASGKTAEEIANALSIEREESARSNSRSKFSTILKSLKTSKNEYEIDVGTKIFIDQSAVPKRGYVNRLKTHYDAEIDQVDFSQPATAVQTINSWAETVTRGHIQHLVSEADAMESTVLILLNAIYFKGLWENQFPENLTGPETFYTEASRGLTIDFMTTTANYHYLHAAELDSQIVKLPYKGNKFAMYIVLPNEINGLQSLIQKINPSILRQHLPSMFETTIELILPKFEFDYTSSLGPILKDLGIQSMFETTAELNDIAETATNLLVVSNVLQKAGLKVNEQGSVAYAATEAEIANKFGDNRMILKVDRPFLFFIEDETTQTVVFVGKVVNPAQQKLGTDIKKPMPAPTAKPCVKNSSGGQCTPQKNDGDNLDRLGYQNQNTVNHERFNYFDTDLLKEITRKEHGNVVISPASVKTVLALLLEAAEGTSYNELQGVLRLPENRTAAQEQLQRFQETLLGSHSNQAVTLKAASRVFLSRDYTINATYDTLLANRYQSGVTRLNFVNPEVTASNINDWVKMITQGLIPSLLEPSMVQPDTHLILTNAIYFKGNWLQEFSKSTKIQCFYAAPNACSYSYMMMQIGEYKYRSDSSLDAQIIQLPYEDQRYSMVVVLPNKNNGIAQLDRDIPHKTVQNIVHKLEKTDVVLSLPRFTIEYSVQLIPILQILGIHEIFTDAANLPNLLSDNTRSKVGAVVHKAKIEVNEKGTKAGAGTGAAVIPLMSGYTPIVTADHPFYFFIYDEQAQTVLFSGRVNNPDEVTQADFNRLPVIAQPQPLGTAAQHELQPQSQPSQQSNIRQPAQPTETGRPTQQFHIRQPAQPTESKQPSQIISRPPQSGRFPSTAETVNGPRYEPDTQFMPYPSTQNNDKIHFLSEQ